MDALEQFGDEIWIAPGPVVESAGFRYPTRMSVIRLEDGGLFVCAPVALSEPLRAAIDALGPVRWVVAPNSLHYLALGQWRAAYPQARLYGAPGLRARVKSVDIDEELGEAAPWGEGIEHVIVRGNAITTEIVFFHRKSGAVLFTDLLQNFPRGWFGGLQALIAQADRMIGDEPQTPQKFRLAFTDRTAARASIAQVLAWPADKVLMAHGAPVREGGQAFLQRAFAWLMRA